jgi:hypothetical protein
MKKSHLSDRNVRCVGRTAEGILVWHGDTVRHGNTHSGGASAPGSLRRAAAKLGAVHGLTPQQVIVGVNRAKNEEKQ